MESTIIEILEPQTIPNPSRWNFKKKQTILQKIMPYHTNSRKNTNQEAVIHFYQHPHYHRQQNYTPKHNELWSSEEWKDKRTSSNPEKRKNKPFIRKPKQKEPTKAKTRRTIKESKRFFQRTFTLKIKSKENIK